MPHPRGEDSDGGQEADDAEPVGSISREQAGGRDVLELLPDVCFSQPCAACSPGSSKQFTEEVLNSLLPPVARSPSDAVLQPVSRNTSERSFSKSSPKKEEKEEDPESPEPPFPEDAPDSHKNAKAWLRICFLVVVALVVAFGAGCALMKGISGEETVVVKVITVGQPASPSTTMAAEQPEAPTPLPAAEVVAPPMGSTRSPPVLHARVDGSGEQSVQGKADVGTTTSTTAGHAEWQSGAQSRVDASEDREAPPLSSPAGSVTTSLSAMNKYEQAGEHSRVDASGNTTVPAGRDDFHRVPTNSVETSALAETGSTSAVSATTTQQAIEMTGVTTGMDATVEAGSTTSFAASAVTVGVTGPEGTTAAVDLVKRTESPTTPTFTENAFSTSTTTSSTTTLPADDPTSWGTPFIVNSIPYGGQKNVPVSTRLCLQFSEAVEAGVPGAVIKVQGGSSGPLHFPIANGLTEDENTTCYTLPEFLELGQEYSVSAEAGAWKSIRGTPSMELQGLVFSTARSAVLHVVDVSVKISGLNYTALMADPAEATHVQELMSSAVASQANVPTSWLKVALKPGSVIGELKIVAPNRSAGEAAATVLADSDPAAFQRALGQALARRGLDRFREPSRLLSVSSVNFSRGSATQRLGYPQVRSIEPVLQEEVVVQPGSKVRFTFDLPVQQGPASILIHAAGSDLASEPTVSVQGTRVDIHLPDDLTSGTAHALVLQEAALMGMAGDDVQAGSWNFTTAGPTPGSFSCIRGVPCKLELQGVELEGSQVAAVATPCQVAALEHPSAESPFGLLWNAVANGQADLGTALGADAEIINLCWRPHSSAAIAVHFGGLTLLGPKTGSVESSCLLTEDCSIPVDSGAPGSIALFMGGCNGTFQASSSVPEPMSGSISVVQMQWPHPMTVAGGPYDVCWGAADLPPSVPIGRVDFQGPSSLASPLHPIPGQKAFRLEVAGRGMPSTASVWLAPETGSCAVRAPLEANEALAGVAGRVGATGDLATSQHWQLPALPPGSYSICWSADDSSGAAAIASLSVSTVSCGDGVRASTEECDDGNSEPFDGCDAACFVEPGFLCEGEVPDLCNELVSMTQGASVEVSEGSGQRLVDGTDLALLSEEKVSATVRFERSGFLREVLMDLPPMAAGQSFDVKVEAGEGEGLQLLADFSVASDSGVTGSHILGRRLQAGAVKVYGEGVRHIAEKHAVSLVPAAAVAASTVRVTLIGEGQVGLRELQVVGVLRKARCSPEMEEVCERAGRLPCEEQEVDEMCGACVDGTEGAPSPSLEQCEGLAEKECVLSDWSAWDECSSSCGLGWRLRRRVILQYPDETVEKCPSIEERVHCNRGPCPSQAEWCNGTAAQEAATGGDSLLRRLTADSTQELNFRRLAEAPLNLSEEEIARLPPEIQDIVNGLNSIPDVEAAQQQLGEEAFQQCDLSPRGEQVAVKLSSLSALGEQIKSCPLEGFYLAETAINCDEDCSAGTSQPVGLEQCSLFFCCEPCADTCKQCTGPAATDCLTCKTGDVQFLHLSGDSECISQAICQEMECFRPTKDGRCVPDDANPECAHVAASHQWGEAQDDLEIAALQPVKEGGCARKPPEVKSVKRFKRNNTSAFVRRMAEEDEDLEDDHHALVRRLSWFRGSPSDPDKLQCQSVEDLMYEEASQKEEMLRQMAPGQILTFVSPHMMKFFEGGLTGPLTELALGVWNRTVERVLAEVPRKATAFLTENLLKPLAPAALADVISALPLSLPAKLEDFARQQLDELRGPLARLWADRVVPQVDFLSALAPGMAKAAKQRLEALQAAHGELRTQALQRFSKVADQALTSSALDAVRWASESAGDAARDSLAGSQKAAGRLAEAATQRMFSSKAALQDRLKQEVTSLAATADKVMNGTGALVTSSKLALEGVLPNLFSAGEQLEGMVGKLALDALGSLQKKVMAALPDHLDAAFHAVERALNEAAGFAKDLVSKAEALVAAPLRQAAEGLLKTLGVKDLSFADFVVSPLQKTVRRLLSDVMSSVVSSATGGLIGDLGKGGSVELQAIKAQVAGKVKDVVLKLFSAFSDSLKGSIKSAGSGLGAMAKAVLGGVRSGIRSLVVTIKESGIVGDLWARAKGFVRDFPNKAMAFLKRVASSALSAAGGAWAKLKEGVISAGKRGIVVALKQLTKRVAADRLAKGILEPLRAFLKEKLPAAADAASALAGWLGNRTRKLSAAPAQATTGIDVEGAVTRIASCLDAVEDGQNSLIGVESGRLASALVWGLLKPHLPEPLHKAAASLEEAEEAKGEPSFSSLEEIAADIASGCGEPAVATGISAGALATVAASEEQEAACAAFRPPLLTLRLRREAQLPSADGSAAATFGRLSLLPENASTEVVFDTLELPDRNNEPFLSRIPGGEYEVYIGRYASPPCGLEVLSLRSVPGRHEIAVICGNYLRDTQGAILLGLGRSTGPIMVQNSKVAMTQLLAIVRSHGGKALIVVEPLAEQPRAPQSLQEQMARLSKGVYESPDAEDSDKTHAAEGWSFEFSICKFFNKDCAFVSRSGTRCAIAFRGSSDLLDWVLENANIGDGSVESRRHNGTKYTVHDGFLSEYEKYQKADHWHMWESLAKDKERCSEIYVAGHSMGGAVAMLHYIEAKYSQVPTFLYTFGQPRIFNEKSFELVPRDCPNTWRFINEDEALECGDGVTAVPTMSLGGFNHVFGQPVVLTRSSQGAWRSSDVGACSDTTSGSNLAKMFSILSGKCRKLHSMPLYIAAVQATHSRMPSGLEDPSLAITAVTVAGVYGAMSVLEGQEVRVVWAAHGISTVRVIVEAKEGDGPRRSLHSWLLDAQVGGSAFVWKQEWLNPQEQYRLRLTDANAEGAEAASRWFTAIDRSCLAFAPTSGRRLQAEIASGMAVAKQVGSLLARDARSWIRLNQANLLAGAGAGVRGLVSKAGGLMGVLKAAGDGVESIAGGLRGLVTGVLPGFGSVGVGDGMSQASFDREANAELGNIQGDLYGSAGGAATSALDDPASAVRMFLGMLGGTGAPACPAGTMAAVDSFMVELTRLKGNPAFNAILSFGEMILTTSAVGYDLVKGIFSLERGLELLEQVAQLIGFIPFTVVQYLANVVRSVLGKAKSVVQNVFLPPAKVILDMFLKPACEMGHIIRNKVRGVVNKLDALSLVLSFLVRPSSELLGEVTKKIGLCDMLKVLAPIADVAHALMDMIMRIPLLRNLPQDPFKVVTGAVRSMWRRVGGIMKKITRPFKNVIRIMNKEFKVCIGFWRFKICWRFKVKDILRAAGFILRIFAFVIDWATWPLMFVVEIAKIYLKQMLLGMVKKLIGGVLPRSITGNFPMAADIPSLSGVVGMMKVDPVAQFAVAQAKELDGCVLPGTKLGPNAEPLDAACHDAKVVNWDAQCDRHCNDCKECRYWFVEPEAGTGVLLCHLRRLGTGFLRAGAARAGLVVPQQCRKGQECFWKDGLTRRCGGANIHETGISTPEDCQTICCHDPACRVWQFNPVRRLCMLGQSWDCKGEGGWIGSRKKETMQEEMKKMCTNFDRVRSLQEGGAEVDPSAQPYVAMSGSTCMVRACQLNKLDLNCTDQNLWEWEIRLKESCDSIPEWEVTAWGDCSSGECGVDGKQVRSVQCSTGIEDECLALAERPEEIKTCSGDSACYWMQGSWGECSAQHCGEPGWQNRSVTCTGAAWLCEKIQGARPADRRTCSRAGCEDSHGQCPNGNARRLLQALQPQDSPEQAPRPVTVSRGVEWFSVEGRRLAAKREILSPQQCAALSAQAATCRLQRFSATPADRGGAAGLNTQMMLCQSAQLDRIEGELAENTEALQALHETVESSQQEILQTVEGGLAGVNELTLEVSREAVAAMKEEMNSRVGQLEGKVRMMVASQSRVMLCQMNKDWLQHKSLIVEMKWQLSSQMENLTHLVEGGFLAVREDISGMGSRIVTALSSQGEQLQRSLELEQNRTRSHFERLLNETFAAAYAKIAGNLTLEIRAGEERLAARLTDEIRAIIAEQDALQLSSVTGALLASEKRLNEEVREMGATMARLMRAESKGGRMHLSNELGRLSRSFARDIAAASSSTEKRASARSLHLEKVLGQAIRQSGASQQAGLVSLQKELRQGNAEAVQATEALVSQFQSEVRAAFASLRAEVSSQTGSLSKQLQETSSTLQQQLSATHQTAEETSRNVQALLRRNDLAISRLESVEQQVELLQQDISALSEQVRVGQQEVAAMLTALNSKIDVLEEKVDLLRISGEEYQLRDMLRAFDESAVLIDGAFLDFHSRLLPHVSGNAKRLSLALKEYASCGCKWDDVVTAFAQVRASEEEAQRDLRLAWGTVRDRFVLLAKLLTDGKLLEAHFRAAGLLVSADEMRTKLSGTSCRAWLAPVGAGTVRSLLEGRLRAHPLALARRARTFWQEIEAIIMYQEALGIAIGARELEHVQGAYHEVLRELLRLRAGLSSSAQGKAAAVAERPSGDMKAMHLELLDRTLPSLCVPPPACGAAIFKGFAEHRTGELLVWRELSNGSLVVLRSPSLLLRLDRIFSFDIDLGDVGSLPPQLRASFPQSVYLCVPTGEKGQYAAFRPGQEPAELSDAFRFCSVPAAGTATHCGTPGSSYGQLGIDSLAPSSPLDNDMFAEFVEDAKTKDVVSTVCGNSILELGEVCDEGDMNGTGACLGCISVKEGFQCQEAGKACMPLCGDGLTMNQTEECDDGGLSLGCTASCLLTFCRRIEPSIDSVSDPEALNMWLQSSGNPALGSKWDSFELQGYWRCFGFGGEDSVKLDIGQCRGRRLVFAGLTASGAVRHDVEFEEEISLEDPQLHVYAGPYLLRTLMTPNGTAIVQLSCRVSDWDTCRFWAVGASSYRGSFDEGLFLSQKGRDETLPIEFSVYVAPTNESLWGCGVSDRVTLHCGDGLLSGPEQCDDGNSDASDGCSGDCVVEPGFICPGPGLPCRRAVFGDGLAGSLPNQCDAGQNSSSCCHGSITDEGCLCHADCRSLITDTLDGSEVPVNASSLQAFFAENGACCFRGPEPQDFECDLGQPCIVRLPATSWYHPLDFPSASVRLVHGAAPTCEAEQAVAGVQWTAAQQRYQLLAAAQPRTSMQDPAGGLLAAGFVFNASARSRSAAGIEILQVDGMDAWLSIFSPDGQRLVQPIGEVAAVFSMASPAQLPPGAVYQLCWGPAPDASWAQERGELRGHAGTSRDLAFPVPLGVVHFRGPVEKQDKECTLGQVCTFTLEGQGLEALPGVLSVFTDDCRAVSKVPARLKAIFLSAETLDADSQADDEARFVVNETDLLSQGSGLHVAFEAAGSFVVRFFGEGSPSEDALALESELNALPAGAILLAAAHSSRGRWTVPVALQEALWRFGANITAELLHAVPYAFIGSAGSSGEGVVENAERANVTVAATVASPLGMVSLGPNGTADLGELQAGSGRRYEICWAPMADEEPLATAGTLKVLGPVASAAVWRCTLGEACHVNLTGLGLQHQSGELSIFNGVSGCKDGRLEVAGMVHPVGATSVSPSGQWAAFHLGTSEERVLGVFEVCWRTGEDAGVWISVGSMHIREEQCNMEDLEGLTHDCDGVGFLRECTVSCLQGWAGKSQTRKCLAAGELSGTRPQCIKVDCSSVAHALDDGGHCVCKPGFFGKVEWNAILEQYSQHACVSCADESNACPVGMYRHGCGGGSAGECAPCTGAPPDHYYTTHGGVSPHGCSSFPCVTCPIGMKTQGCGAVTHGECVPCTNAPNVTPASHFYTSSGSQDRNCSTSPCMGDCPVGEFLRGCSGTSPGFCSACTPPPAGMRHMSSGGLQDACEMAACPPCHAGFYRSGCRGGHEGVCVPCSNQPQQGFYYSGHGGMENECPFEACAECPVGQWRTGCLGSSPGICTNCTQKPPETYFISHGGVRDICQYRPCGTDDEECNAGEFRQDCGSFSSPTFAGVCRPCTLLAPNHFFSGPGLTRSTSCPQQACQRCGTGYFRNDCGGTSPGHCLPCKHRTGYYFVGDGGFQQALEGESIASCTFKSCNNTAVNCQPGEMVSTCGEDPDHTSPGSCVQCPRGTFSGKYNAQQCTPCGVGEFSISGSSSCQECPVGKYANKTGSPACTSSAGGSVRRRRATEFRPCPAGYSNDGSSDECTRCQGGSVRRRGATGRGAVSCIECPLGFFDDNATETDDCLSCSGGSTSRRRATTCVACGSGYFNGGGSDDCSECVGGAARRRGAARGALTCSPCPVGSYDNASNSDDCTSCAGGESRRRRATECHTCESGRYNDGSLDTCELCPGGAVGKARTSCTACRDGWFRSGSSTDDECSQCTGGTTQRRRVATTCSACSSGKYNTGSGDECLECPGGSTRRRGNSRGAVTCDACPAGWYRAGNSSSDDCVQCVGGQTNGDATSCSSCPAGFFNPGNWKECRRCSGGSVRRRGPSGNLATTCTECGVSSFDDADEDDCKPCLGGSTRRRRAESCSDCEDGDFNDGKSDDCTRCVGGTTNRRRSSTCSVCDKPGEYGSPPAPLPGFDDCRACVGGSVSRRRAHTCTPCPAGHYDNGATDDCSVCVGGAVRRRAFLAVSCTACGPGHWDAGNEDDCRACPSSEVRRRRADHCSACPANQFKYNSGADSCEPCKNGEFGTRCELYRVRGSSARCQPGDTQQSLRFWLPRQCCEHGNSCCGAGACCTTPGSWTSGPPTCGHNRCYHSRRLQEEGNGSSLADDMQRPAVQQAANGTLQPLGEAILSKLQMFYPETRRTDYLADEGGLGELDVPGLLEDEKLYLSEGVEGRVLAEERRLWGRRRRRRRRTYRCHGGGQCVSTATDGVQCLKPGRR